MPDFALRIPVFPILNRRSFRDANNSFFPGLKNETFGVSRALKIRYRLCAPYFWLSKYIACITLLKKKELRVAVGVFEGSESEVRFALRRQSGSLLNFLYTFFGTKRIIRVEISNGHQKSAIALTKMWLVAFDAEMDQVGKI